MALRIPLTRDQTLQVEFHEIERRLRRLEKGLGIQSGGGTTIQVIGGGGSSVDESDIKALSDRIDALDALIDDLSDPATQIPDFGGEGPEGARGLVPNPGNVTPPTGIEEQLLNANGEWGYPLRGLLNVVTPGDETNGSDTVNLRSNLIATGKIVSSALETGELRAHGVIYGEPEQARLRGLVQVTTDPGQSELVDDKITVLADVHMQDLSATRIECVDLAVYGTASIVATIDGGVP